MRKTLATLAILLLLLAATMFLRLCLPGVAGFCIGAALLLAEIFIVLGW